MFLTSRRTHTLLPRSPILRLLLLLLFLYDTLKVLNIYSRQLAAIQYSDSPPKNTKRIYIASQHWNTAPLLRDRWNNALLELVRELGFDNVFVAIYESGSFDDTKSALIELDLRLEEVGVQRNVTLSDVTHEDEIRMQPSNHGWIKTPKNGKELRRIPFLATIRNRVLEPLRHLGSQGETFDTVLFLNDVVFTPKDVLNLLHTNQGSYAAACSLDFSNPPHYYDTFALRDSNGEETTMSTWPYFRSRPSKYAMQHFLPVPVTSCWNGMVAMAAEPFVQEPNPLRFRAIPDSLADAHLEGSECCLIHADNPLSARKGVFLNPMVRVAYSGAAYDTIHTKYAVMSAWEIYAALWKSRVLGWSTTSFFKSWVVKKRVWKWESETAGRERGGFCLINEMQVIYERGWKHV